MTTSTSGMTFEEMSESITGFDEIAVEQHMGMDLYTDGQAKPVRLVRALVFVHLRRGGATDADAKQQAMGMSVRQVNAYFEQSDDLDPEGDPDTESGKGDSQPDPGLTA